jgi:ankyrin repeat protein
MAVINGYYELAALLLEGGADPNVGDPRGSLLHALTFMRRPGSGSPPLPTGTMDSLELAAKLLARGANPNARITWKEIVFDRDLAATRLPPNIPVGRNFLSFVGATPFYVAAKHGDVALMRLLVSHGADPRMATVQGVTPLMAAAGLGFWDGESPGPLTGVSEAEAVEAVKLALDLGNDINAVPEFGGPPLEGDGATLLRRHPLNLQKYDGAHDAPLAVVPPKDSLGDMRWNGSTALHGAAMRGSNAIVQFLVDHGARLDARNKLGWTPLMCAEGVFVANTEKDWPETVALMRKLMAERGLNPDLYNQASLGVQTSRTVTVK